jgi:hypothetical protein
MNYLTPSSIPFKRKVINPTLILAVLEKVQPYRALDQITEKMRCGKVKAI